MRIDYPTAIRYFRTLENAAVVSSLQHLKFLMINGMGLVPGPWEKDLSCKNKLKVMDAQLSF